jgi:hypothetical protein
MDSSMDKIKARIAAKKKLVEEKSAVEAAKRKEDELAARKEIVPTSMDGLLSVAVSEFTKEGTIANGYKHVYTIDVTPTGDGDSWHVRKRFSEFETLHGVLKHRLQDITLPPKSISYDAYERQTGLHFYLNACIVQWELLSPEMQHTLRHFLDFEKDNIKDAAFRLSTLPVHLYNSDKSTKLKEEVEIWEANLGPDSKAKLQTWCTKPEGFLFLRQAPRGWADFESAETGRNTLGSQNLASMSRFGGVTTQTFSELYMVKNDLNLCYFEKANAQQFLGSGAPPPSPPVSVSVPAKKVSTSRFSVLASAASKMKAAGKAAVRIVLCSAANSICTHLLFPPRGCLFR